MVYMAADTTLTNFAVESLKQMKAGLSDYVNVVVEFDSGRALSTERYFFGEVANEDPDKERKIDPLASISHNIVLRLEAQDVGDPETLANFIDWSVNKYPAYQYFLILWGHGSGIDDDAPNLHNDAKQNALEQDRDDRFFILRHHPLPTTKSELTDEALKSISFVDRPVSYLTNEGLKKALKDAQTRINRWENKGDDWRLDLLGMDACNMNLIELGYEVRKFANYLIASQDEIPDASWPYYNILHKLQTETEILNCKYQEKESEEVPASTEMTGDQDSRHTEISEKYEPQDIYRIVRNIAKAYTEAYQDYIEQPVALSALNLEALREDKNQARGDKLREKFGPLIDVLQLHTTYREINDAIIFARRRVRSFYTRIPSTREFHTRDIYVDLIHFCNLFCTSLKGHEKQPEIKDFIKKVEQFVESSARKSGQYEENRDNDLHALIAVNEKSRAEEDCNGTSIYFPATPADEFGSFYEELEFAQDTLWAAFIVDFLGKNPHLFIPPKFEMRATRVKGNPHDDTKGNPRDITKGNPRVLDKSAVVVAPGPKPMIANHSSQENISPSIYNVIYNYGTIVELGADENVEGE